MFGICMEDWKITKNVTIYYIIFHKFLQVEPNRKKVYNKDI